MPDIAEHLDAAIGVAPTEAPALPSTLALGRRALRRRRLAYGVGAAATALVVGGTAWAGLPADDGVSRSEDSSFTGDPADAWPHDEAAWMDPVSGELLVRPGWSIAKRVDDPITGVASSDFAARTIDDSIGLVLSDGTSEQWVIVWWAAVSKGDPGDGVSGATSTTAGEDFDTFGRWLAYESEVMTGEPGGEVWGREAAMLDTDGTLITKPGWEVAERIDDPFGKGSLAVDMTDGEQHQWFLWEGPGSEISDTRADPARPATPDADYATFASWVTAMVAFSGQPSGEGER